MQCNFVSGLVIFMYLAEAKMAATVASHTCTF